MATSPRPPLPLPIQFIVGFLIPTIILMAFSDESKLGPFLAMSLALAPPIILEVYSLFTGRKLGWISIVSIIGILLIGVISLLGLNEAWLGVRRAAIYVIGALFIIWILQFKRAWIDKGLEKILDMQAVRSAVREKRTEGTFERHVTRVGYLLVVFLLLIAVWTYILTIITITAPTGSSEFNAEYASLRVISIPYVTVPFFVGMVALMIYLGTGIEKLTGLDFEQLVKKKRP